MGNSVLHKIIKLNIYFLVIYCGISAVHKKSNNNKINNNIKKE